VAAWESIDVEPLPALFITRREVLWIPRPLEKKGYEGGSSDEHHFRQGSGSAFLGVFNKEGGERARRKSSGPDRTKYLKN